MTPWAKLRSSVVASALLWCAVGPAFATGAGPPTDPLIDPTPCVAAAAADDAGRIVTVCGALIDNAKTAKADRLRALIARAGAYQRQELIDRAIGDYDAVLRLDPALADIFNTRGELWRKKGDRGRALADFAAAARLNPDHPTAKASHKALAQELERLGAQMAVAGRPSFNCATSKLPVEKAICANPELADLDREINDMHIIVVREAVGVHAHIKRALQRDQEVFLARRNAEFGRPGYDLRKAMKARLRQIVGADGF